MSLETFKQAIVHKDFSHVTSRPWCGVIVANIYHFDKSSPTGVKLVAGHEDNGSIADLLRGKAHRFIG